jgi:HlyD family secretion protein
MARWLIITGLLLLLGSGLAYWWFGRGPQPVTYVTVAAERGPVTRVVNSTGTVNPVLTIMVGTYVSGVIQELTCDYNTQVKKDQLCAKIDPRPYQTIVDQDRANVSTSKAQLQKDKASLAYARLTLDRNTALLKDGVVSQDVFDNSRTTYDQLQAQVGVDEATIEEREAELNTAEVNLGYTNITSPVDGTVVSRNVTMGQTVAASFQTPTLFLIATDLTKMQVDTNVSESDMGNLRKNNRTTFTVEAFPNRVFEGTVVQVRQSPQTVQNVVTYDIVVAFDNRDLALKPGMTATTRIVTAEQKDVLRVPDQAFRYAPGGSSKAATAPAASAPSKGPPAETSIWVLRNNQPYRIAVKAGLDDDSFTQIVSGDLQPGDRVILSEQSGGQRQKSAPAQPRL